MGYAARAVQVVYSQAAASLVTKVGTEGVATRGQNPGAASSAGGLARRGKASDELGRPGSRAKRRMATRSLFG